MVPQRKLSDQVIELEDQSDMNYNSFSDIIPSSSSSSSSSFSSTSIASQLHLQQQTSHQIYSNELEKEKYALRAWAVSVSNTDGAIASLFIGVLFFCLALFCELERGVTRMSIYFHGFLWLLLATAGRIASGAMVMALQDTCAFMTQERSQRISIAFEAVGEELVRFGAIVAMVRGGNVDRLPDDRKQHDFLTSLWLSTGWVGAECLLVGLQLWITGRYQLRLGGKLFFSPGHLVSFPNDSFAAAASASPAARVERTGPSFPESSFLNDKIAALRARKSSAQGAQQEEQIPGHRESDVLARLADSHIAAAAASSSSSIERGGVVDSIQQAKEEKTMVYEEAAAATAVATQSDQFWIVIGRISSSAWTVGASLFLTWDPRFVPIFIVGHVFLDLWATSPSWGRRSLRYYYFECCYFLISALSIIFAVSNLADSHDN